MRSYSDLEKLYDALAYRLLRLRRLYNSLSGRAVNDTGLVLANVVIELDNLVLSGLREFLISSLRGARTKLRVRVTVTSRFDDEDKISAYILSILNTRKYASIGFPLTLRRTEEPTIRDPRDIRKVLAASFASNLPSVDSALSLNSAIFRDLGTVRNFYAHRNADTWSKARNKAISSGILNVKHADEYVLAPLLPRPVSVFEDWLDDAELFFDEITK